MSGPSSVSLIIKGYYQRSVVEETAGKLLAELGKKPSFAVLFATPDYMTVLSEFIETIKIHGSVPVVVGCSTSGLMGKGTEIEGAPGFSLQFFYLPNAKITPVQIKPGEQQNQIDLKSVTPNQVKLWVTLINPFYFVIEDWLETWNSLYPGVPIFGGVAAAHPMIAEAWVFHDDQLIAGAIALAIEGDFDVSFLVSQGCQPVGKPCTVTRFKQNLVYTLDDQPADKMFQEAYQDALRKNPRIIPGQILAGLAMPASQKNLEPDSVLVRKIFGHDPINGALSLGYEPQLGQSFQFQLRDPQSSSQNLKILLEKAAAHLKEKVVFGALICTCTDRGEDFFGLPHHDAKMFMRFFPQVSLSGFFSRGEIGPFGGANFSHEQSSSIVIFHEK